MRRHLATLALVLALSVALIAQARWDSRIGAWAALGLVAVIVVGRLLGQLSGGAGWFGEDGED